MGIKVQSTDLGKLLSPSPKRENLREIVESFSQASLQSTAVQRAELNKINQVLAFSSAEVFFNI